MNRYQLTPTVWLLRAVFWGALAVLLLPAEWRQVLSLVAGHGIVAMGWMPCCCGGLSCPNCATGTTPQEFELTISGYQILLARIAPILMEHSF